MNLKDYHINSSWCLFLDRDGVINERIPGDYIKHWNDFVFLPGVPEALKICSGFFKHIFIVTNQQGIGRGLMTEEQLAVIHTQLIDTVKDEGGLITKIYHCPYKESDNHENRKPGTGMALLAKKDFPEVDFQKSIMIGDSVKDMEFGRKLNMLTIFINNNPEEKPAKNLVDFTFDSLLSFSKKL